MWLNRNIRMERSAESHISNCPDATQQRGDARLFAVEIAVCSLDLYRAALRQDEHPRSSGPFDPSLAQIGQSPDPITAKPPAVSGNSTIKFENVLKASHINFVLKTTSAQSDTRLKR